jgi:hypothetical protein
VHYYFRCNSEPLTALIKRLLDEQSDPARMVAPGDTAESLHLPVSEPATRLARPRARSRRAPRGGRRAADRYQQLVRQVRAANLAAADGGVAVTDVDSAARLLAQL